MLELGVVVNTCPSSTGTRLAGSWSSRLRNEEDLNDSTWVCVEVLVPTVEKFIFGIGKEMNVIVEL